MRALSAGGDAKSLGCRRGIRVGARPPSAVFAAVACCAALGLGSAGAQPVLELVLDGRVERIATVVIEGTRLVPLTPLCRNLELSCELRLETSSVAVSGPGGRALLSPGSLRVPLGDLILPMTAPSRIHRGEVMVPLDFLPRVAAQLLNRRIELWALRASVLDSPPPKLQDQPGPLLPKPVLTVVIDPGHGGKDTGATGRTGLVEKDVALKLALAIRRAIEKDPSFRAVLTRTEDVFLDLPSRTVIANERGECFVSVHLNAGGEIGARGFEVYSMSPKASDKAALAASRFENQLGASANVPPELEPVLWDMAQNDYLNESATFAEMMVTTLSQRLQEENRGAKQAPFLVLAGATVPAILVEAAFISNAEQEAALRSDAYLQKIAESLAAGIATYLERYRSKYGTALMGP